MIFRAFALFAVAAAALLFASTGSAKTIHGTATVTVTITLTKVGASRASGTVALHGTVNGRYPIAGKGTIVLTSTKRADGSFGIATARIAFTAIVTKAADRVRITNGRAAIPTRATVGPGRTLTLPGTTLEVIGDTLDGVGI